MNLLMLLLSALTIKNLIVIHEFSTISKCAYYENLLDYSLHFSDLSDLLEIKPACLQEFRNFSTINFYGKNNLIIKGENLSMLNSTMSINYFYFDGLDIKSMLANSLSNYLVTILITRFRFYKDKMLLDKCDDLNDYNVSRTIDSVQYLEISYCLYPVYSCPFVFTNFFIKKIFFYFIADSFFNKNYPSFLKTNITQNINSTILHLEYERVFQIKFDATILNNLVYLNTKSIKISGIPASIEHDTFTYLPSLKRIDLILYNIRIILHQTSFLNSIKTFHSSLSLQGGIAIDADNVLFIGIALYELSINYKFPYEDICFFRDYPNNNLAYTIIEVNEDECNCTIMWLILNKPILKKYLNFTSIGEYQTFFDYESDLVPENCAENFDQLIIICNFSSIFKNCLSNEGTNDIFYHNFYTVKYDSTRIKRKFEFIEEYFLTPIFGTIGLIFSLLSIQTHNNKKMKTKLKKDFFKYAKFNSYFNALFCSISLLKISLYCIEYTSKYCPNFLPNLTVQNIYIYIFLYLLPVTKFCCFFTELGISYSRLKQMKTIQTFTDIQNGSKKYITYLIIIVILSLSINSIRLFEFEASIEPQDFTFPADKWIGQLKYTTALSSMIFKYASIIYFILPIILFAIPIFVIDLKLLMNIKNSNKNRMKNISINKDMKKEDMKIVDACKRKEKMFIEWSYLIL